VLRGVLTPEGAEALIEEAEAKIYEMEIDLPYREGLQLLMQRYRESFRR
jgi:hypothetical protein